MLAARSLYSSDRSASTQRSYRGVMGGGVFLHSSLSGPFFSAATGTGRRLSRSFAAAVGRRFVVNLFRGRAVLCRN